MADVKSYIDNTQQLMNDLGDKSQKGTEVATLLADYRKTSTAWNSFLNSQIRSNGGDPSSMSSEQEKIDFIREHTFYGGQDKFLSELQGQVESRDSRRDQLKNIAEEILKKQQDLIEKNNKTIEELNEALKADIEKRDNLTTEIAEKQNEIDALKEKYQDRKGEIADLEDEISALSADPDKNKAAINVKRKEISKLKQEQRDFSDKVSDLDAEIKNKTKEKNKIKLKGRQDKINQLSDKNNELKKHLDKNYKEMDSVFSKDGIKLQNPSITVEQNSPEPPSTPGDGAPQTGDGESSRGGNTGNVNTIAQTQQQQPQNALVKLSDKQIAMNMSREFRQAKTTEERKKMIDGYGYTDLVAMLDRVGPFERKRISNALVEARDYMPVPEEADLIANIQEITGDSRLSNSAYRLLFSNGNARYFKDLSVDELRNIQRVMDIANERREEIGKSNPEALEYFDQNFANFVKTGSLVERARTGWFKNFWADMVNGKQKAARDNLSGSMRDYTMKIQDEKAKKVVYENNIRSMLGQEVKPVSDPMYEDRGYSRHDSLQQDIDRRSTNSQQPQQR